MRRQNLRVAGTRDERVIHVRYMGESRDIELSAIGVSGASPDADIFRALARWLEVDSGTLQGLVIERHENGNMTARPEAVFG